MKNITKICTNCAKPYITSSKNTSGILCPDCHPHGIKAKRAAAEGVKCKLCDKVGMTLVTHINRIHKLSILEYKEKFGEDVEYISGSTLKKYSLNSSGENNPWSNHGGKFSPFSDKFIKYKEMSKEEKIEKISSLSKQATANTNPENRSTSLEYYATKGLSLEEAKEALKDRQNTFSLEKCIARHGIEEGTRLYEDRQIRWQDTLKSKPQEEIDLINLKKNIWSIDSYLARGFTREESIRLCSSAVEKRQLGYSKEAIEKLKSILPTDIFNNGMHSENEYYIYDNRHYFYDFRYKDLIIEYHGTAYHASPYLDKALLNEWKHPFSKIGYEESFKKDKIKRELAISKGFTYLEIYNPMPENEYNKVIEILNNYLKHHGN